MSPFVEFFTATDASASGADGGGGAGGGGGAAAGGGGSGGGAGGGGGGAVAGEVLNKILVPLPSPCLFNTPGIVQTFLSLRSMAL